MRKLGIAAILTICLTCVVGCGPKETVPGDDSSVAAVTTSSEVTVEPTKSPDSKPETKPTGKEESKPASTK